MIYVANKISNNFTNPPYTCNMKRLAQVKEDFAVSAGFESWEALVVELTPEELAALNLYLGNRWATLLDKYKRGVNPKSLPRLSVNQKSA